MISDSIIDCTDSFEQARNISSRQTDVNGNLGNYHAIPNSALSRATAPRTFDVVPFSISNVSSASPGAHGGFALKTLRNAGPDHDVWYVVDSSGNPKCTLKS